MKKHRLAKEDDLQTGIKKLVGKRDALEKWGYGRQARQMNFYIGVAKLVEKIVTNLPQEGKRTVETE